MRTGSLIALGIIIGSTFSTFIAMAWTAPTASPPGNNVSSPVNVGGTMQFKNGTLGVNDLGVFGDTILSGSGTDGTPPAYLNFGATAGTNGYGIRNNAGILEFKNLNGSWGSLNVTLINLMTVNGITPDGLGRITSIKFGDGTTQTTAGGAWITSGNNIYNSNSGNVGIGTASPSFPLDIVSSASGNAPFLELKNTSGSTAGSFGPGLMFSNGVAGTHGFIVNQYQDTNSSLQISNNASPWTNYFTISQSGNVGIGTSAPWSPLTIQTSGETAETANDISFIDYTNSPISIGFVGARARGTVSAPAAVKAGDYIATFVGHPYNGSAFSTLGGGMFVMAEGDATPTSVPTYLALWTTPANSANGAERMRVASDGNVLINTTSNQLFPGWGWPYVGIQIPSGWDGFDIRSASIGNVVNLWRETNPSGTFISFTAGSSSGSPIGVGSITTNGSTVAYNTTSDRRIKENITTSSADLATLLRIPVRDFDFIKDSKHVKTTGFIAQELYPVFPEAVTTNGDNGLVPLGTSTPWSVDYGRVTPLIVKAVQDIASLSDTFKATIIAWLGSATNGITDLYASIVHSRETDTQKLCINSGTTQTCITQQQLAALLASHTTCTGSN